MEERINRLKELLDKENYPSVYLFKFIIKKDDEKMQEIKPVSYTHLTLPTSDLV